MGICVDGICVDQHLASARRAAVASIAWSIGLATGAGAGGIETGHLCLGKRGPSGRQDAQKCRWTCTQRGVLPLVGRSLGVAATWRTKHFTQHTRASPRAGCERYDLTSETLQRTATAYCDRNYATVTCRHRCVRHGERCFAPLCGRSRFLTVTSLYL